MLDIEEEKALVQQEVSQGELWQSIREQLLPLISQVTGMLNRQIPR